MADLGEPTAPGSVAAADERSHEPGGDRWWNESWYFDFAQPDGSLGGYVRLGLYPNQQVAWYWAALVGPDRATVLVREHEVALPRGTGLEIRHEGLWADHVCETALDHWSLGLEAFGVALDDPADAFRGERGHRTALGLDLEWETAGPAYPYPGVDRYEVPCRVHGEILVGDERIELDGVGERDHSWGVRDWWQFGWWWTTWFASDGTAFHGMALADAAIDGVPIDYHAGFVTRTGPPSGGSPGELIRGEPGFTASDRLDADGLLEGSDMTYGDRRFTVDPIAHAPVLLDSGDGRTGRFARSLCRWTEQGGHGATGVGWYERNQPDQR